MASPYQEAFEVVAGHIVVDRDGVLAVLDTGTPFSLSAPEIVAAQLGRPIELLIGCDEMVDQVLEIDWAARTLRWSPSRAAPSDSIPVHWSPFGVPLVEIAGPDGPVRAAFDTGAPLSYVPPAVAASRPAVRQTVDFLPGIGEFETTVVMVPITYVGTELSLECGVLPPLLRQVLSMICPGGWIIGSELLRDVVTQLDLSSGWVRVSGRAA